MFSTGAFNPAPMGFPFPAQQQQPGSIYQSQYGGFNPQIQPPFQQAPSSRGQSLPASIRQYPPPNGPYAPGPASSSRRHGHYPPSGPAQHHEHRSSHGSKSKKHHKRRSVSPGGTGNQDLYSDKEQREEQNSGDHSGSHSSGEENAHKDQQQSHAVESVSGEESQGGTTGTGGEEQQRGNDKHKSSSKKNKHHRHDRYENYHTQYQQQQPGFYGNFQNEQPLPPHIQAQRPPMYGGYNQAYEESVRRVDDYRKQARRSSRGPPENEQQQFPFGPNQGYPQQPFGGVRPQFNPYQPYGPQPGYYGPGPAAPPPSYNALQPWSNMGAVNNNPADQEIQRLRSHIHSLEGELQKLQKKLNKTTLQTNETSGQDESNRSHREHRRSKRDGIGSPRQTPVIVELNNTTGETIRESSSKKHRHRTGSNTSSQQGPNLAHQDITSTHRSGGTATGQEGILSAGNVRSQSPNQQQKDSRDRSRSGGNQIGESEDRHGKQSSSKNPREETAAQLAQAAAAHVNGRQGPAQQVQPPPPVPRQQIPVQQQNLHQQGAIPVQGQQIRGPAPRFPVGGNIQYPGDPYHQQRNLQNPNYNQSNNNELFDDDVDERRKQDSAEKILDAFERSFVNHGRSTIIPIKVKYIPEENNSNPKPLIQQQQQQQNMNNNNNRYRSTSRRSNSSSSTWSSSVRSLSRRFEQKTTRPCDA